MSWEPWSEREDTLILRLYEGYGPDVIAERINRTRDAVVQRHCRLVGPSKAHRQWKQAELDYIKAHYKQDMESPQIADELSTMTGEKITKNMVISRAQYLIRRGEL